MNVNELITPAPLAAGDLIAIASPATIVERAQVEGAVATLESRGFRVRVMPHAFDCVGSFAGALPDRIADFEAALTDPEVKALLCSRGGYGTVQLLPRLAQLPLRENAKWVIGLSDVTALHCLLAAKGIASIHGSMTKALANQAADSPTNSRLFAILGGDINGAALEFDAHPLNRYGDAEGTLLGGNLAVFSALLSTPYDFLAHPAPIVLFIEDIAEPIYKVNRILYQLLLGGAFEKVSGIVFGQFTDYRPDRNFEDMYAMIDNFLTVNRIDSLPIAFNAPIGHFDGNLPMVCSRRVNLCVTPDRTTLSYL